MTLSTSIQSGARSRPRGLTESHDSIIVLNDPTARGNVIALESWRVVRGGYDLIGAVANRRRRLVLMADNLIIDERRQRGLIGIGDIRPFLEAFTGVLASDFDPVDFAVELQLRLMRVRDFLLLHWGAPYFEEPLVLLAEVIKELPSAPMWHILGRYAQVTKGWPQASVPAESFA